MDAPCPSTSRTRTAFRVALIGLIGLTLYACVVVALIERQNQLAGDAFGRIAQESILSGQHVKWRHNLFPATSQAIATNRLRELVSTFGVTQLFITPIGIAIGVTLAIRSGAYRKTMLAGIACVIVNVCCLVMAIYRTSALG